eukprot:jgi/Mesen1/10971/ME000096S10558
MACTLPSVIIRPPGALISCRSTQDRAKCSLDSPCRRHVQTLATSTKALSFQGLSFTSWTDSRRTASAISRHIPTGSRTSRRNGGLGVVCEIAGQYEDNFEDVHKNMMDYFTFKAVKTVLGQLQEMNPPQYTWFYNFVVNNKLKDSKEFIRTLVKKYNHADLHTAIKAQNLELLRERLIQTVKLTADVEDDRSENDDFDKPPPSDYESSQE